MNEIINNKVIKSAENIGYDNVQMINDIITMMVDLRSNDYIYSVLVEKYNDCCLYPSIKRKFNTLLKDYIIRNYYDDFILFCRQNSISMFNADLEVEKKYASSARIIFIVFLREEVRLWNQRNRVRGEQSALHDMIHIDKTHTVNKRMYSPPAAP
ncbi:MAG TPA: hypothetical protein PK253_15730 [Spirochaetota bacterium]|nr:hypothetical protein [Spirochaetota bacterium]